MSVSLNVYVSSLCVYLCVKVLLDDSIISVGTVASSRYVAPIKGKVKKLLTQLILFNQTLVKSFKKLRLFLSETGSAVIKVCFVKC